jgi:hypothetical protein
LKEIANVVLLFLLGGAVYTHYALKDQFERMVPSLIFSLLILCRFIILYQVNRREQKEEELIKRLILEARTKCEISDDELDNHHREEAAEGLNEPAEEDQKKIN